VYVFILGLVGIAMGLMFLFALSEVPTWCRWLICFFAPLFVVGGSVLLFFSLRGRKADLQELTGCSTGKDAVTAMREIGALEGISAAPEGGAAFHALKVLIQQGRVLPHHRVVVFNTGGALKYLDVLD
jgi:hypothetical protein